MKCYVARMFLIYALLNQTLMHYQNLSDFYFFVCVCVCVCRWVKKELCSLYLILYNITNLIYENPLEIYIVAGPYIQLSVRPLPAQ